MTGVQGCRVNLCRSGHQKSRRRTICALRIQHVGQIRLKSKYGHEALVGWIGKLVPDGVTSELLIRGAKNILSGRRQITSHRALESVKSTMREALEELDVDIPDYLQ